MIDFDLLIKIASLVFSIGAAIFAWIATRRKDVEARFDALKLRLDLVEGRLTKAERDVQAAPAKEDLHALQIEMTKIGGALEKLYAVMEGNQAIMSRVETIVARHEDHLLRTS